MEKSTLHINEKDIPLYAFNLPMMHEDWHEAEKLELVYVGFDDSGNDYWDNEMVFTTEEFAEETKEWWIKSVW